MNAPHAQAGFRVTPRPPWTIQVTTTQGTPEHAHMVECWWACGFVVFEHELCAVECLTAHAAGWRWKLVPVAHEGAA